MPDWTDNKHAPFKTLVDAYINSLNNRAVLETFAFLIITAAQPVQNTCRECVML